MVITQNGNNCLATDFRLAEWFTILGAMPGRKKWVDRHLIFQPTGANIAYLMEHCPLAEWKDGAEKLRDDYIALKQREANIREDKLNSLTDDSGYQFRTAPYRHQLQAFLLSRELPAFALFHEQRTGKTKVILDTAAYLFEKGEIDRLVVLAKKGVHINWVLNEIPEHLPERIQRYATYYTNSWHPAEYRAVFSAAKIATPALRILTLPIEGLVTERAKEMVEEWLKNGKALLVIDESSRIKNHSAQRTKWIVKIGKLAPYRRIMTGTPLTSGLENLYPQFKFLDERILGYSSFYTFRAQFCIMGGFEGRAIIGYKHIEELIQTIDGHSHRVLRSQCFDMPRKVYSRHPFEMAPSQRKLYDAYRKSAIEEVQACLSGGDEVREKMSREIAITRALRLHQIACGYTPDKEMRPLSETDNPRMDALMEEIEEAEEGGRKVIVWARFSRDLHRIYELLGKKAVRYYGGVPEKERIEAMQRFQQDDKVRIFVGHAQAAGYGLTLSAAEAMIYHSNLSSLDLRLQSEDRAESPNSTRGTAITDIEAFRSVDQKIIRALREHKSLADQINRDPVSLFMEEEA